MGTAILLSGGMDSAALAWWKRPDFGIFINYGQRPAGAERAAAKAVAEHLNLPLECVDIDCSALGSGTLAGSKSLPDAPTPEWWPYRNQLLITIAGAVALRVGGIHQIWIGSVAEDEVNRDGSVAFRTTLSKLMELQEGGISIDAPAARFSAMELVKESAAPAELLGWTHSCFVSDTPCLRCRGCQKHLSVLDALDRRWPSA